MPKRPTCTGYAARGKDGKLYRADTAEAALKAAAKPDSPRPDQLASATPSKGKGKGKPTEEEVA